MKKNKKHTVSSATVHVSSATVQPFSSGVAHMLRVEGEGISDDSLRNVQLFYDKDSFSKEVFVDSVTDISEEDVNIDSYEELLFYIEEFFKDNLKNLLFYRIEDTCYPVTCIKRNDKRGYYIQGGELHIRTHKALEYLNDYAQNYWNELKIEAWMLSYESVVGLPISVSHEGIRYDIKGIELSEEGIIIVT